MGINTVFYVGFRKWIGLAFFSMLFLPTVNAKSILYAIKIGNPFVDKSNVDIREIYLQYNTKDTIANTNKRDLKANTIIPYFTTDRVREKPIPPGGVVEFNKWVDDNYVYPQAAIDAEGVKGTLVVSFLVKEDGSLSDFKVLSHLGYDTGELAIKLLKKSKIWSPALQGGKPIEYIYTLSIDIDSSRLKVIKRTKP